MRLTKINDYGYVGLIHEDEIITAYMYRYERRIHSDLLDDAFEKLKRYEDAEEQGLLLRLPCKVGDTVYRVSIIGRDLNGKPYYKIKEKSFAFVWLEKLGKTVFLTREEAEAKLKELGENG